MSIPPTDPVPLFRRPWPERKVPTAVPKQPPSPNWPIWAVAISGMKTPGEKGVGDTIARLVNLKVNLGEAYKAARRALGIPCNCEQDQAKLNALYPYLR